MYCIIQYSDIFQNGVEQSEILHSTISAQMLQSIASNAFETKRLLVNPNCPVKILLDFICDQIGFDKNMNYDLCDSESGELLYIKQLDACTYATKVMKFKQIYLIVFFEKNQNGQYKIIEPLLQKQSKQYSEIMFRLKRHLGTIRRTSSGYKKCRRGSSGSKLSLSVSLSSCNEEGLRKRDSSISRSKRSNSSKS